MAQHAVLLLALALTGTPEARAQELPPRLRRDPATNEWILEPELLDLVRDDPELGGAIRAGLDHVAQGLGERSPQPRPARNARRNEAHDERQLRIRTELEALSDHDWAGHYDGGGGFTGHTLELAPRSGAVYSAWGCMYEERAEGDVEDLGRGHLRLGFALDARSALDVRYGVEDRTFLVDDWYVVRWGDERYLVPSSQMIAFCNEVPNPNSWTGFSRFPRRRHAGGYKVLLEDDLPEGAPEVPAPYRRFLLDAPVDCTVVEVDEPERFDNPGSKTSFSSFRRVRVDAGARQGLLPGMLLRRPGASRYARTGQVVYVGASNAVVDFRFSLRHGRDPEAYLPQVGWSLRAGPRRE